MTTLKPLTVIGLNSGTSMDGIDAAAFRIIPLQTAARSNGHSVAQRLDVEMLESHLHPLDSQLVRKMQRMIASGRGSFEEIIRLNAALGEAFGTAALALMKKGNLTRREVDLIGSHGQTIWHAPQVRKFAGVSTHGTMQLGDASIIASRTGLPVVSDFRSRDLANGGQGAPLVAFADEVLFGGEEEACGVLNLGGIANITVLDSHGSARMAFDTGPGNLLIDRACELLFEKKFDASGELAGKGSPDTEWLKELMQNPYFAKRPPKTTGRELFGSGFADELIENGRARKLNDHDILATVTAITAKSIAQAYSDFIQADVPFNKIVLGGGGAENNTLTRMLTQMWPGKLKLERHEDYGISTKFKEALLFALLAYTTHFGIPNNVPRCTGASQRVCLGTITRA